MTSSFTVRLLAASASFTIAFVLLEGVARLADPAAATTIAALVAPLAG